MKVRCRFTCTKADSEKKIVRLDARYENDRDPEVMSFATATPWGYIEFGCDNPRAFEQFVPGSDYYIDIEKIEPVAPADQA